MKEWTIKWLISFNPVKTEVLLISNIFRDYDLHPFYDTHLILLILFRHLFSNK